MKILKQLPIQWENQNSLEISRLRNHVENSPAVGHTVEAPMCLRVPEGGSLGEVM